MPGAVEELLRYESPSQHTARLAPDDVVLGGKQIRKRQAVIAVMAAGNRDPERFPDPDRLDLDRPDNRHLAFGWAAHFCFGAPLARLEAEIAFGSILTRIRISGSPTNRWSGGRTSACAGSRPSRSRSRPRERRPPDERRQWRPPSSPPTLREARFADYPQIFDLESTFFDDSLSAADRRSLFEDNPLWPRLRDTWPVGWVLEDVDGRIVGAVTNIPSAYLFAGSGADLRQRALLGGARALPRLRDAADGRVLQPGRPGPARQREGGRRRRARSGAPTPTGSPSGTGRAPPTRSRGTAAFARAALVTQGFPARGRVGRCPPQAVLRLKDALTAEGAARWAQRPIAFCEVDGFDARFDAFWLELIAQNPGQADGRARRRVSAVALRRSRCGRGGCGWSPRCATAGSAPTAF